MSFIHEALKEAQRERSVSALPDSTNGQDDAYLIPNSSIPQVKGEAWLGSKGVVALGAVGLLLLGWWMGQQQPVASLNSSAVSSVPELPAASMAPPAVAPPVTAPVSQAAAPPAVAPPVTAPESQAVAPPLPQAVAPPLPQAAPVPPVKSAEELALFRVVGVKDGCTLDVRFGQVIRVIRLADISCLSPATEIGKMARTFAAKQVFTKEVQLESWSEHGSVEGELDVRTQEGFLLNQRLVLEGLATAQGERFLKDEERAQEKRRGMWNDWTGGGSTKNSASRARTVKGE